jgi:hypothetical protein
VLHVEERRGAAERGGVASGDLEVGAVAVARGLLERVGATGERGEVELDGGGGVLGDGPADVAALGM